MLSPVIRSTLSPVFDGLLGFVPKVFSPFFLYGSGEQGAWYDPSDLTTLFQDAAGTTPVTAHGQPVGLMLDKSGNGHHASQPTAASRPLYQSVGGLQYLLFDGIDDFLVTGSINFTGTDKMSVFAGVRKLSDASRGMLVELGNRAVTAANSFSFNVPDTSGVALFAFNSRADGGSDISANTNAAEYASPITVVLAARNDISGDSITLRINSVLAGSSSLDQGAGSYSNRPLYIGRRGGTSLPFSGHLYGLIIRGALTDDPTTIKVENLLAGKTGVAI